MEKEAAGKLLIGAHMSIAGGLHNAITAGHAIGATTIQVFTANQKRWKSKELTPETIELWNIARQETGVSKIMSHDSYLINLGSPNPEILQKSKEAFRTELERCIALNISFLNFHPGAAVSSSPQQCLDLIVDSLLELEPLIAGGPTELILETTAGQGSAVGWRFEELAYIINRVGGRIPLGVCIDTCHIFVAGYDIRTAEGWDAVLNEFDAKIGLRYLKAFHVNDSLKDIGSRVDRHQPLGQGKLGLESFRRLMQDPRTHAIPKYLETPEGPPVWEQEIRLLREYGREIKPFSK